MALWEKYPKQLQHLDPNEAIKSNQFEQTIVQLACRAGARELVDIYLKSGMVSIVKKNKEGKNCGHMVLEGDSDPELRFGMLKKLLEYKGPDGKLNIRDKDNASNSMLHLAAASGLTSCCMHLIYRGLAQNLYEENKSGNTPAAAAESNGYTKLAAKLEGFIVFDEQSATEKNTSMNQLFQIIEEDKAYQTHKGMSLKLIRAKKDEMVLTVASFFFGNEGFSGHTLFKAECLLAAYHWSVKNLQHAFLSNPSQVYLKAGVDPPQDQKSFARLREEKKRKTGPRKCLTCGECAEQDEPAPSLQAITDPLEAEIFADLKKSPMGIGQALRKYRPKGHNPGKIMKAFNKAQGRIVASKNKPEKKEKKKIQLREMNGCGHAFCNDCWRRYLKVKIKEGQVQSIICPAFDCNHRVPSSIIDYPLVDKKTAQRYMKFELRDFVKENKDFRWCPAPGCSASVCRHQHSDGKTIMGHTADCGQGHFFCFECGGEPHDPCSCAEYEKWNVECKEMSAKLGTGANENAAAIATMLWLKTNTKQCPKCKSSIQKNEGCNHMTCRSCRHEFCWICMAPWSTHGSRTGGYYKCNVFKGAGPTDNKGESKLAKNKLEESKRFIHFIERIKVHEDSKKLEQKMVRKVDDRIREMQEATVEQVDTKFVHVAFRQLYWNRIVLCASYIKKYYSDKKSAKILSNRYNELQASLESSTEALSNAIARKRWVTRMSKVISLTLLAQQARNLFLNEVMGRSKYESKSKSNVSNASKGGGQYSEKILQLQNMGFKRADCIKAITATKGNLDQAVTKLLS
eukprot:CAMPEP_0167764172 /NCGR_PEP_ID=MMETSP0110_2-20121227/13854_1 /TAXON_ID=629695 /ORGANISM="Gymnochlora sp., Strain CCMP2014" /LENGTH=796 /DNA_ID=CAMNT_0007651485 /DNA_START=6 /DNA_END=2396 /DNA_ORIENTATION=-